jgi:hypothetical protein
MDYERVSNGWKMTMDCYPFRAHYIKLYRKRFDGSEYPTSDWMLEHVECIREDMDDYINLMLHAQIQEGMVSGLPA